MNHSHLFKDVQLSTSDITIPSTLITLSDGKSLIADYVYNQTSVNATPQ